MANEAQERYRAHAGPGAPRLPREYESNFLAVLKGTQPYTYLVQACDGGPVKIGSSDSPADRLRGLQTGNPRDLMIALLTCIPEAELHRRYADRHIRGEWFYACATMRSLPVVFTPRLDCAWFAPGDDEPERTHAAHIGVYVLHDPEHMYLWSDLAGKLRDGRPLGPIHPLQTLRPHQDRGRREEG